jgi:hypothetical protein
LTPVLTHLSFHWTIPLKAQKILCKDDILQRFCKELSTDGTVSALNGVMRREGVCFVHVENGESKETEDKAGETKTGLSYRKDVKNQSQKVLK